MKNFKIEVKPQPSGKTVVRLHRRNAKYRSLLSIDGGGAKAVIPITVLTHFEECVKDVLQEVSEECKKIPKEDMVVNVGDCFDTISGNSSGSIVALYIASEGGRKDLYDPGNLLHGKYPGTMEAAQVLVKEKLPVIFDKNFLGGLFVWTKYTSKGLEKAMKDIFGDITMKDLKKHTYIPAFELNNRRGVGFYHRTAEPDLKQETGYAHCNDVQGKGKPKMDKSSDTPSLIERKKINFPAWLVAKSSASAPTFFPLSTSKDETLLSALKLEEEAQWADGGLVSNNPSMQALAFMGAAFSDENEKTLMDTQRMAVLSIGTGRNQEPVKVGRFFNAQGILGWGQELVMTPMDSHVNVNGRILDAWFDGVTFGGEACLDRYLRVNQIVDPDEKEVKKLGDLDSTSREDIENFEAVGKRAAEEFDPDMREFLRKIIMKEAD